MPDFSAAPVQSQRVFSISLRDFTGDSRAARIPIGTDTTTPEITAARTAIGNLSNGRVMETNLYTFVEQINPGNPLNTTFDEAYATMSTVLVLMYQNDAGLEFGVEIGAPDASLFTVDGKTVNTANALIIAANTAILAAANNGGVGTYAFQRGYLSQRSRRASRAKTTLPLVEPAVGANPPIAPGA